MDWGEISYITLEIGVVVTPEKAQLTLYQAKKLRKASPVRDQDLSSVTSFQVSSGWSAMVTQSSRAPITFKELFTVESTSHSFDSLQFEIQELK